MRPFKAACVLSHFTGLLGLASAAKLAFNTPDFNTTDSNNAGLPYFVQGDWVTISWRTLFDNTTLSVNQIMANGTTLYEMIAVNFPRSKTEVIWPVNGIGNHSIAGSKFYFFLQKAGNEYCNACSLTSSHFIIESQAQSAATATTSSKLTTFTSTSTSSPTARSTTLSTTSAAPTQSATTVAPSDSPKTAGNRSIQIGVGLGAGIPAFLALILIFFLWTRHRNKKQRREKELIAGKTAKTSTSSENLTSAGTGTSEKSPAPERDSHLSRESGALGPYAQNPSPTWEQQEAREQEQQEYLQQQGYPQHQGHHRASSSRRVPFQPSLGAHSEVSDESSRHSWINEFEFERPGYQDSDEMSQVQRRIQNAPSSSSLRSYHGRPGRSGSSIMDVSEIPDVPQPAYHWYNDPEWG